MHGFGGHMSQNPCILTGHHAWVLTKPMHGDRLVGMGSSQSDFLIFFWDFFFLCSL
jgi:hypothetical protein